MQYGKGRIQSVYELDDGSALFVTVATYRTPAGTEIDMKGGSALTCGAGSGDCTELIEVKCSCLLSL